MYFKRAGRHSDCSNPPTVPQLCYGDFKNDSFNPVAIICGDHKVNRKHIRRQFSCTLLSYIPFFRKYPAEINKYILKKKGKKREYKVCVLSLIHI